MGAYLTFNPTNCLVFLSSGSINGSSQWYPGLPASGITTQHGVENFVKQYPGYITVPAHCKTAVPVPKGTPGPGAGGPSIAPAPGISKTPAIKEPVKPTTGPPEECGTGYSMITTQMDDQIKEDTQPIVGGLTPLYLFNADKPLYTQQPYFQVRTGEKDSIMDAIHEGTGRGFLSFHSPELQDYMLRGNDKNGDAKWPTSISDVSVLLYNSQRDDGSTGDDAVANLAFGSPSEGDTVPNQGGMFSMDLVSGNATEHWLCYTGYEGGLPDTELGLKIDGHFMISPNPLNTNPQAGMMMIDSGDSNELKWYDGTEWVSAKFDICSETSVDGYPDPVPLATEDAYIILEDCDGGTGKTKATLQSMASTGVVGGRLTMNGTQTNVLFEAPALATTLYYTPYSSNNILLCTDTTGIDTLRVCHLYADNVTGQVRTQLQTSTLLVDTVYDVYAYWDSELDSVELDTQAWSSLTSRGYALVSDVLLGLIKNGDRTRRYIGTVRTQDSGGNAVIGDGRASRHVCNFYNCVPRRIHVTSNLADHTYNSSVIRAWAGSGFQCEATIGRAGINIIDITGTCTVEGSTNASSSIGFGLDSTTTYYGESDGHTMGDGQIHTHMHYGTGENSSTEVGSHTFYMNEATLNGNVTYQSVTTSPITVQHATIYGTFWC